LRTAPLSLWCLVQLRTIAKKEVFAMLNVSEEYDVSNPVPSSRLPERPRILIVDDDSTLLTTLSKVLANAPRKYNIGVAGSAEDALAIIKAIKVDVLVTDLYLPAMDGLALAQEVRDLSPDTAIILMTAFGNYDLVNTAHNEGCVSYLEKPFDFNQFVRHVDFALQGPLSQSPDLATLNMAEIIRSYAQREKNIALNISSDEASGLVVIENGVICHAQYGEATGPEALSFILSCADGVVTSLRCDVRGEHTLALNPDQLDQLAARYKVEQVNIQESPTEKVVEVFFSLNSDAPGAPEEIVIEEMATEVAIPEVVIETEQLLQEADVSEVPPIPEPPFILPQPSIIPLISSAYSPPATPSELRTYRDVLHKGFHSEEASKRKRMMLAKSMKDITDFDPAELVLQPEPPPEPVIELLIGREKREAAVKKCLEQGLQAFRTRDFEKARESWLAALRHDTECEAAKNNLRVLQQIVNATTDSSA